MKTKIHYSKMNPFFPLSDNAEIIGDNVSLGYLERNMTGCFRLLSAKGVEILRDDGWSDFMLKVHFHAQEKDVVVNYCD